MNDLDRLTISNFKPLLHQTLPVRFTPDITLPAEIVDVSELGGYTPLERVPFSIIIRTAQRNEYFTQGTYTLVHPTLDALPVFLVPLGVDGGGMRYEAVFS